MVVICIFIILLLIIRFGIDEVGENQPPTVDLEESLTVYTNCSFLIEPEVHDLDGDINRAVFEWDLDGDGVFEENISNIHVTRNNNKTHIYHESQVVNVTLKITDEKGKSNEDVCVITVISEDVIFDSEIDKFLFLPEEQILITTSLHNNGPLPINFSMMSLLFTTIDITVETPEGYELTQINLIQTMPPSEYTDPYDYYNYTFDLRDSAWNFATEDRSVTNYEFDTLGKYTVTIMYDSYPYSEVWLGNTDTLILEFWVI
jgi:hypothetical protein